jgi:tetratricopeptide (TPR) repeat protein
MGYTWVLKDWIPKTWGSVQQWVGRTEILTVIDWEWMHGSETGVYFGCEGHIPVVGTGLTWFPRFGFNNRTEGASFGAGLFIPFSGAYNLGMDYAYLVHPNLPNDSRIFLTFRLGPAKDAVFFRKLHRQQEGDRRYLFNILSDYPNAEINGTVKILAEMDKRHADRYFGLLEGLERAEWLYARSVALLKANEIKKSKDKASDAAMEFQAQFGRQDENPLSDDQLLHYSEMLILTGRMADADSVLQEIRQPSLHSHFLSGTSHKGLGHWDAAIGHFKQALAIIDTRYRDEPAVQSIDGLAALGLAESWLMRGLSSGNDTTSINNALLFLDDILSHPAARLDSDYPRYPVFNDGYCIDDAQLLKGITLVMAGRIDEGVAALLETNRFYSILDNGRISRSIEDRLIGLLQDGDVEGIIGLARDLLATYAKSHALAVSGEP